MTITPDQIVPRNSPTVKVVGEKVRAVLLIAAVVLDNSAHQCKEAKKVP